MFRSALLAALALVLASCGGSDVFCSYASGTVQVACADYSFSGDAQGQDVTTLEQNACTSGKGTVVASCPTTDTLGTCTIEASTGSATVTAVEHVYATPGATAAQAEAGCMSANGTNGVSASWSTP